MFNQEIFRDYDIRGVFGVDFDSDFARALGFAFSSLLHEKVGWKSPIKIAVSRDCRLSGEELSEKLIDGLLVAGNDVLHCGIGPTPQLYHCVATKKADAGIQITGSHNPVDYNGFKMMVGMEMVCGEQIKLLLDRVLAGVRDFETSDNRFAFDYDHSPEYCEDILARSLPRLGQRRLRVVVDSGNGAAGVIAPLLLRKLGCELIEINSEFDGRFPSRPPDPTDPIGLTVLSETVRKHNCMLGFAFDGDADRLIVVDERGQLLSGDQLLYLFAREIMKEKRHPRIIADVRCSSRIFSDLVSEGAEVLMSRSGNTSIKQMMRVQNADLGGEVNGHFFFADHYLGYDDGIYAAVRVVEMLSKFEGSLAEMVESLPGVLFSDEIRLHCDDRVKFDIVDRIKGKLVNYKINSLDGVRISFSYGWALLRASNTEPALIMRFEAENKQALEEYKKFLCAIVEQSYLGNKML